MAPMQVSMRASAATLAVLGLLAASFRRRRLRCREPERRRPSGRSPNARALPRDGRRRSRSAHRAGCRAVPAPSGPLPGRRARSAHAQGLRPVWTARAARAERPGDRHPRLGRRGVAVRARLARLSVCGLRRRARRAHRHRVAEVPALGRPQSRTEPQARRRTRPSARPVPRSPIKLLVPVAGAYGDLFGPRGNRFHAGIDIPSSKGTPVGAAADGRVVFAAVGDGFGKLVVLQHAHGVRTRYAHLSRIGVRVGAVREGPRHDRPRRRDGRGDGPAPALRGARARGQRGSIVRALARTMPSPRRQPWARPKVVLGRRGRRRPFLDVRRTATTRRPIRPTTTRRSARGRGR